MVILRIEYGYSLSWEDGIRSARDEYSNSTVELCSSTGRFPPVSAFAGEEGRFLSSSACLSNLVGHALAPLVLSSSPMYSVLRTIYCVRSTKCRRVKNRAVESPSRVPINRYWCQCRCCCCYYYCARVIPGLMKLHTKCAVIVELELPISGLTNCFFSYSSCNPCACLRKARSQVDGLS